MRIVLTAPAPGAGLSGKVADAELHFTTGPLAGLKLIGFGVWHRRNDPAGYNVTFPARQYAVNGERRSLALLRPVSDLAASDTVRDLIVAAYREYQTTIDATGAAVAGQ